MRHLVLALNTGSSSVKAALFEIGVDERLIARGSVTGIGSSEPVLALSRVDAPARPNTRLIRETTHDTASSTLLAALVPDRSEVTAVIHRVVHGGPAHAAPERISPGLLDDLRRLAPLAPDHLPASIGAIELALTTFAGATQVACFDTAFHRSLPRVARLLPLPRRFADAGLLRYGFHGLSCEGVVAALAAEHAGLPARLLIAHLGSGVSLTAVKSGVSIDTTMGFTPLGGVMMSTRPGDLDPGALLHLLDTSRQSPADLRRMLEKECGLLGVSGRSADMRELLALAPDFPPAADAVDLFCHLARKALGGLIVTLGGLDALVFTGGIGEHAAAIRDRLCQLPEAFGLRLSPDRNARHASVISSAESRVLVRIVAADEERVMARHVRPFLPEVS